MKSIFTILITLIITCGNVHCEECKVKPLKCSVLYELLSKNELKKLSDLKNIIVIVWLL